MKREDLRSRINPTTIENTDEYQEQGNKEFNTTDSIYLDSYNEQFDGEQTSEERKISATDYALMNNAYQSDWESNLLGRPATFSWLRSA